MSHHKKLIILLFSIILSATSKAQLQFDHLSFKGFSAFGFGGFLNFAMPVSDANYATAEAGLDVFSSNGNNVAMAPVLVGYRK